VSEHALQERSATRNGEAVVHELPGASSPNRSTYTPAEQESVDLFRLLDELEELPEKAKHLPLNILLGFNSEQFYYLVLKIRANLPEDLKKAHRVARDTERIVETARSSAAHQVETGRIEAEETIAKARAEANRVIENAHAQSAHMVEQSEIHRMAADQARDILQHAETEAGEIRRGADDYARDVLAKLEAVMGKAMTTVQRGRETLDSARSG
jgi:hypothetical protein